MIYKIRRIDCYTIGYICVTAMKIKSCHAVYLMLLFHTNPRFDLFTDPVVTSDSRTRNLDPEK